MLSMSVPSGDVCVVSKVPPPPVAFPDPAKVREAALLLTQSKRPLVIIGKGKLILLCNVSVHLSLPMYNYFFNCYFSLQTTLGAAYGKAESELQDLIHTCNLPFLPTPMGKGVVSDMDQNCVGPARSSALLKADAILLFGARLNWMLHFGRSPRFNPNVKIIQVLKFLYLKLYHPILPSYLACL